jgi:uncharacterized protein
MSDKTDRKSKKHINDDRIFYEELEKLLADEKVRGMSKYRQHFGTNTLKHSIRVAQTAFDLSNRLGWDIDEKELARGALLHDYYQYSVLDERIDAIKAYRHGTRHPWIASKNAEKDFGITDKEKNIIRSHMWPLTLRTPPKSREAALVCMADKLIAIKEMVFRRF